MQMRDFNRERTYPSPSMLPSCPRQVALKRFIEYYVPIRHNWVTYRGTIAHTMMEHEPQEEAAVLEQTVRMPVTLSDGRVIEMQGKPDKHVKLEPSEEHPGQWILIDYKTISELTSKPKLHWIWQTNVYAEMLRHNGVLIDRIIIQQIGMDDARQIDVDLKPSEAIRDYIRVRLDKHIGSFDGSFTFTNLPPMLNAVDDPTEVWLCNSGWCPVERECKQLAKEELIEHARESRRISNEIPREVPEVPSKGRRGRRPKAAAPDAAA